MENGEEKTYDVPAIADNSLIAVAENAEKRIEAVKKIKQLALKVTNGLDWVSMGGKPYLQSSGAEKIARLFGISWQIDEPTMTQEEGGHFAYTYKGLFSLSGVSIEAVGTRSSKDPFFSRAHGGDIPASEIDKGDVKKAAFTNLTANGITRLLGIRNLTVEDLASAGIVMGKGVEYKTTGNKEEKNGSSSASDKNDGLDQKQMQLKIQEWLLDIYINKKDAEDELERMTAWEDKDGKNHPGKRNAFDLAVKETAKGNTQTSIYYHQIKKLHMEWKAKMEGEA